jgi:hypothetical protein
MQPGKAKKGGLAIIFLVWSRSLRDSKEIKPAMNNILKHPKKFKQQSQFFKKVKYIKMSQLRF